MGAQTFFVPGVLPGMNEIVAAAKGAGGRGYGYAAMKKKATGHVVIMAKSNRLRPMESPVHVAFEWHEIRTGKKRGRDMDNIAAGAKFVFDGLVDAKVITEDNWGHVTSFTHAFKAVARKPGVLVTIVEVHGE